MHAPGMKSAVPFLQFLSVMSATPNGIAHVSYPGGGIFVPARTPYDRQMLVEQVVERVHAKGAVQILIDDRRWIVRSLSRPSRSGCAHCGASINSACTSTTTGKAVYCMKCALGDPANKLEPPQSAKHRTRSRLPSAIGLIPHPA